MTDRILGADFKRRGILQAGGAGLLSMLGAATAQAADNQFADLENANIELVTQFCLDWSERDVEKLVPYLADNLEYQIWEGGAILNGIDEFREQIGAMMGSTEKIEWEIYRSAAIGNMVINERLDHFIRGGDGSADWHFYIAGIFIVKDGKIEVWRDYNMPTEAP